MTEAVGPSWIELDPFAQSVVNSRFSRRDCRSEATNPRERTAEVPRKDVPDGPPSEKSKTSRITFGARPAFDAAVGARDPQGRLH